MDNTYTGFSNYNEINLENRKNAIEKEITKWGDASQKYKKYRQEWKKAAEEEYLPTNPLHIDIELSDACNLRCSFCAHGLGTVKNVGFMDEKLATRLIDECVEIGVYSIKFNWRGEVAINPFLPKAVKYAKEKGILEVQINTNGLPKEKETLIECAKNGIDRIIFSIDGFSKESYEFVRVGGDYEKLMENVHNLLNWKKENNKEKPFIRVQMVRTNTNAHEVDDFIKYWQPKVDDVRISDVMNRGQGDNFSVGDQITVGRRRCPQPFQRMIIAKDGRVSPCCGDWNQDYVVGDVNKSSIMEIWNSEKMKYMREVQNKVELDKIDICKNCYVKESYLWRKKDD